MWVRNWTTRLSPCFVGIYPFFVVVEDFICRCKPSSGEPRGTGDGYIGTQRGLHDYQFYIIFTGSSGVLLSLTLLNRSVVHLLFHIDATPGRFVVLMICHDMGDDEVQERETGDGCVDFRG